MNIRQLQSSAELQQYDTWITSHPLGNLWQSLEWKAYQESLGRKTRIYVAENNSEIVGGALVVIDTTSFGLSTWDIPRGPVWEMQDSRFKIQNFLEQIMYDAKKEKCMNIYMSPLSELCIMNCEFCIRASARHEQSDATRLIDVTQSEEEILAGMHQKGRYNIKVAQKNGVTVQQGIENDMDAFYAILEKTGSRDGFTISPKAHYSNFLSNLSGSFILMAYEDREPIAGLIGVTWNGTGFYYYGASDYEHRAMMAPYLLQWEAMKHCKQQGCTNYDLLGIAPPGSNINHPWSGITSFKEKFGGTVVTYPPEQQVVLRPWTSFALQMKRKVFG